VSEDQQQVRDFTANAMRLTLNAQLALTGELVAFLVTREGMRREQVITMITKLADTIGSSIVEGSSSDSPSVLLMPLREHADALRKIVSDLEGARG
jgi:hypothetical protein